MRPVSAGLMIPGNTPRDGLIARPDTFRSATTLFSGPRTPYPGRGSPDSVAGDRPGDENGHRQADLLLCFQPERNPASRAIQVRRWDPKTLENLPIILVVEDDQLLQRVVEETLTDGGFDVVIAASGENAVELLDTADGKYRALVTDVNLGRDRMNGWDVARRAREIDSNFPVVYMSGDSAEDWSSRGVPDSIMLPKPFAPAQLFTAVSQILNGVPPAA